jgi:hypothetical protein
VHHFCREISHFRLGSTSEESKVNLEKPIDRLLSVPYHETLLKEGLLASTYTAAFLPLELRAEGFQLSAKIDGLPSNGLAFGTIRVNELQEKSFEISTQGKFPLRFKFVDTSIGNAPRSAFLRRTTPPLLSEIEDQLSFLVNPVSGIVSPGAPIQVTVKCKAVAELNIQRNLDLRLLLFKPTSEDTQPLLLEESKAGDKKKLTKAAAVLPSSVPEKRPNTQSFFVYDEALDGYKPLSLSTLSKDDKARQVESIVVQFSLRSVYSRFHLLPASSLNFGPLEVGLKRSRTFKLFNDGEFEFNFRLYAANDAHPQSKFAIEDKLAKEGAADESKSGTKAQKLPAKAVPQKQSAPAKTPTTKPASGSKKKPVDFALEASEVLPDLKIGAFTFSPSSGQISPGKSLDITVLMEAIGGSVVAPEDVDKVSLSFPLCMFC